MASNEEGDTNTQPSNSNTSYSPSPPHSPRVYVYDDDNNLYYGYYHRSPVNYPPTPTHNYMHEDAATTLPTPPYDDTLPHSPSSHNPMSFLFSHPPFRYNATAPSYLPSSPGNNPSSSSRYYAPYKSARCLVCGYGHTEQDSATVFVNNDNDTEGDSEAMDGFSPYGHNEGDSGAVLVNNDNEAIVINTSNGKSFKAFCPPHASVFDCNICMEMAKEPVVTSCGHLYCWPCLYNWLHYHSKDSKCPVCNGEVNESMITPIYGQGSYNDGNSTIRVPPRPCGRRFETTNQW